MLLLWGPAPRPLVRRLICLLSGTSAVQNHLVKTSEVLKTSEVVQNHLLAALVFGLSLAAVPARAPGDEGPAEPQSVANPYYVVPPPPAQPEAVSRPDAWPDGSAPMDLPPGYAPAGLPEPGQEPPLPQPGQYPQMPPAYPPHQVPPAYVPSPTPPTPTPHVPPPVYTPRPTPPAYGPHRAPPAVPYSSQGRAGRPYAQPVRPAAPYGTQPAPPQTAPQVRPQATWKVNEGARIVARVGSEVILASDVMTGVSQLIAANKGRLPEDELRKQIDEQIKRRLEAAVDMKLLWLDAKRTIPPEAYDEMERRVSEYFETKEVPDLIKRAKLADRRELDRKLAELGTSLEKRKRAFIELAVAREWLRQKSKAEAEVTLDEVRAYYDSHLDEFEHPARAKWEELMVRFSEHPNKAEADAKIAWMGNQVFAGRPLAEVAEAHSEGSTASQRGQCDWTTQGCLAAEVLDRAVFALPVGQLSRIIESDRGYHIVRVIEREDAHCTPFAEAQAEIREKLKAERQEEQSQEVLAKLKREIPVWTAYDTPEATSPYDAALAPGGPSGWGQSALSH